MIRWDRLFFFFFQGSPQPGAQKVWQKNKKKGKKAKPQKQQPKKKPVKQQPKKKNSQEEKEVSVFENWICGHIYNAKDEAFTKPI